MYMREEEKLPGGGGGRRRRNPSFSSSLLDSIYRSIDESNCGEGDVGFVRESRKQSSSVSKREEAKGGGGGKTNLRRAMMIENWVERQSVHSSMFTNSASSSSESSSGAAFSSSDQTESSYKRRSKQSPVVLSVRSENMEKAKSQSGSGGGGGFTKTKLRALKIYGELKKAKQPISPGGKIASFINSIFNSGNVKKAKMCYVGAVEDVSTSEHVNKSTYSSSSASTFSRSCLSKPSSRSTKSSNGNKRSVRFYPISVILGEDDSNISSHKCVYEQDPSLMPKPTFQKYARTSGQSFRRSFCEDVDDDESEAESYSSSDLFELNQPVGIGRYTEELPVYETTNFRTNQAIAKGLIL
ncbi:protein BIG GRAIN 1-like B isoform X1 [Argentina anserina]|uniref:protein BIG GRAIN 1-like B isoform X1 n=1 Tax=Argentina anserina TaxID=57926 RepID=UPI0021767E06|nr:protein BIG GRAIN 1-like B isoform X1 [Potentilla anserina]